MNFAMSICQLVKAYTAHFPYQRGKGRLVRSLHRLIKTRSPVIAEVPQHHHIMQLDLADHVQRDIYYGIYETNVIRIFEKYLRPGATIIDCGANIGLFTLIAASRVGPTGKVHAFEPNPNMCAALSHNVRLNGFENVAVNQCGLSDLNQESQPFFVTDDSIYNRNHGAGSLRKTTEKLKEADFFVNLTTIDDYFSEQLPLPTIIKIDTEGAELPILRGGRNIIARSRPVIIMEVGDWTSKAFDYVPSDILNYFDDLAYQVFTITQSAKLVVYSPDIPFTNVVCVPN